MPWTHDSSKEVIGSSPLEVRLALDRFMFCQVQFGLGSVRFSLVQSSEVQLSPVRFHSDMVIWVLFLVGLDVGCFM